MFGKQDKNFCLGNFINITPALQSLANHYGHSIDVVFETDWVADAFRNALFINRVASGTGEEIINSNITSSSMPDYLWNYIRVKEAHNIKSDIPWTYVDNVHLGKRKPFSKYAVIVRGCLTDNPRKVEPKDPGDEIYDYIINKIDIPCVFVGSVTDYKRLSGWFNSHPSLYRYSTNIREAIGLINGAEYIISNDSGLYHVAGALKKKGFILWKRTNFIKNRSPHNFFYSEMGRWQNDFDEWER